MFPSFPFSSGQSYQFPPVVSVVTNKYEAGINFHIYFSAREQISLFPKMSNGPFKAVLSQAV